MIPRVLFLSLAAALPVAVLAEEARTETRSQAVLKVRGTFVDGGLKLSESPTSGPCADLEVPGEPTKRGLLEKGDVITAIDGKRFDGLRSFLDLMNEAHRAGRGRVRITVNDAATGVPADFIARPEVVRMEVPAAGPPDFLKALGAPVPAAPDVPSVPATIDP
jgi:C-terminal processing protease CtpA/Prc